MDKEYLDIFEVEEKMGMIPMSTHRSAFLAGEIIFKDELTLFDYCVKLSIGVLMIRSIIFDWDGVISDSFSTTHEFINKCFSLFGKHVEVKKEDLKKIHPLYPNFYMMNGFTSDELRKQEKMFVDYMKNQKIPLIKGMIDVIYKLKKKGYKLAIVTSNAKEVVAKVLKENGVDIKLFSSIVDFAKAKKLKPHPEPLFICLKEIGENAENSVYVGDVESDIFAAKAAGMKSIGVTWGWSDRERLLEVGSDAVLDNPDELLEIIKTI